VAPAGNFNVEAKNNKGDIELTLPPNASALVNGRTRNGDVVSDFGLTTSGDENKTLTGRIGSGAAQITLITDNGDLRVKRGSATLAAPAQPAIPAAPASPHAPRLKTPKGQQQQQKHKARRPCLRALCLSIPGLSWLLIQPSNRSTAPHPFRWLYREMSGKPIYYPGAGSIMRT
jgi:hypothetical protein